MPGIAGIITRHPTAETRQAVQRMGDCLRHEDFYVGGFHTEGELGVCAAWTAFARSPAAGQVFQNEPKDIALLLAGECSVVEGGKTGLRGPERAPADGAVLVDRYEELGDGFFERLNGLFSGLLMDRRRRQVVLFNDRYGSERIYWHETPAAFYFASEAKALLRVLPALRQFDPEGVAQFLGVGSPLGGRTLFRGVRLLPGASRWVFGEGGLERGSYFSPAAWEALPKLPAAAYEEKFRAVFEDILPRYYRAEARVGISLTGGLDTRLIMACHAHDAGREVSYTFTGPAGQTLDDRVAARVAGACGLEHHLLRLGPDFFTDFARQADRTVYLTDGTAGILGAHEVYFHRLARPLAPVRLTGNYGSEILRAVSTFKPLGLDPGIFQPAFRGAVDAAADQLRAEKKHPDTFAAFAEVPLNLYGTLAAGRTQLTFRTPYLDNALVALAYQCPPELKKSSLPAMRLVKACAPALDRIPTDRGFISDRSDPEILARRIFAEVTFKLDYCSNAGLPGPFGALDPWFRPVARGLGIAGLHKFLQYSTWFREALAPWVTERSEAAAKDGGAYFDGPGLRRMVIRHLAGRRDHPGEINAVLTLESVQRQFFGDPADPA